jgi:amino acid adenylation domain-containing protein
VQIVQPARPFPLPVVDLSALPSAVREARALALAGEAAGRPFDLARGPLLRGLVLRLGAEDHAVALTLHHIVSDGWSLGILVREVSALYAAFAAGRPSPLPELAVQYGDFALWQRSWLHGELLEQEISFWRRQLAGLPPMLDLPTDRPRPARQSYRGDARPLRLPAGLARQVEALARREGATVFMVLLAAFQTFLARTSGDDDLAVGSPTAGRNREELEGLIGFFVNTLVLRGDLSSQRAGGPLFRELLGRVRATTLAAFLHQDVPFEKLVEELSPPRSLAHAPLFQVMFVLQNAPAERFAMRDLSVQRWGGGGAMARFDLTLSLGEHDGELAGRLDYASDLFDAATIDRWIGHFERLLAGMAEEPERGIHEVDLLTPEEAGELRLWNRTAVVYDLGKPLHRWIEEQADRTPDAVAVIFEDEQLSYRELDRRAESLARRLRARGCGAEARVGVLLERSCELPVALLGVLKAGAAYVPLDPGHPADRLAFQEREAGLRWIVTRRDLVAAEESREERMGAAVAADCPAYVLFTSGSTGRPKGVMVSHRAIVNRLLWMLAAGERVAQKTPFTFDVSIWELFWPLMNGGCLVVARPSGHLDNVYLKSWVSRQGIAVLHFVPSMLQLFLDETGGVESGGALRDVVCSGEALSPELARKFAESCRGVRLHNLYGPTEAAVEVTSWTVGEGPERGSIPIGRPIANTRMHLLGPGWQPLPVGVPGELFIGGVPLARGYVDRPDLTAERFLPDPTGEAPGERIYRTGDRARRRPDGAIEYLGRTDLQLKIRGVRIEPGEIEAALLALPDVRAAVVMAREDRPGDLRLVAYVVADSASVENPATGTTVDEATGAPHRSWRERLRERLPAAMVPAAFVTLAALPLTPTGKVDRKALPAPGQPSGEAGIAAPRTPVEELLAGIWAELLGVSTVGADSNFFDLGGHSLLAVRVMGRIEHVFGVAMPIATLFEAPTVAQLAGLIQGREVRRSRPLVRLNEGGAGRPLFLAPPVGGNVFAYVPLARKMAGRRPVYGLQAIDEGIGPAPSLEDLAAQYLATVRSVQATGPWLLGAWSAGVVTAWEMARQIESAGGTALVTMFDPPSPPDGRLRAVGDSELLTAFSRLAGAGGQDLVRELMAGLDVEAGLDRLLALARTAGLLPPEVGKPWLRERFDLYCRTMITVESYVARPGASRLILFRADGMMAPGGMDLTAGWDRLAAATEAHLIADTDHASLLREPALDRLVEILESAFAGAEAQLAAP